MQGMDLLGSQGTILLCHDINKCNNLTTLPNNLLRIHFISFDLSLCLLRVKG